ncbi:aldose epimerase family protein [Celeribacter indicus]|uniref:Aldose 1-epimerase n=1 Tax=Celeribacter indicus TaxID=1208324 RepID=A0A0B5DYW8_9RHOB|nr:aldose epimerase family protein [Celeribacter indicus]AJE48623.1 hypothetical protein P73_3908 [Celeribacter indicus]SDX51011.1 aldose 1-epimerase [Celeribacter indicus]
MRTRFGTTRAGREVAAVTLADGDLSLRILTLGAILNDVRLAGVSYGLTLGSDELAAYDGGPMGWFGAIVGPVANRIAGAQAALDGAVLRFEPNEGDTALHGGQAQMSAEVWDIVAESGSAVTLALTLPDGKGGFPGTRHITARYEVSAPATLTLTLEAVTDRPTFMAPANHSYWRLDDAPTAEGHRLAVAADRYLRVDDRLIPTGLAEVAGTPFDLRSGVTMGRDHPQRFDHNFCLSGEARDMKPAAILRGRSGVTLRMETTAPGLQVFDGAPIESGAFRGHRGVPEVGFCGIALEAQHWPDAPHHPEFPSIVLRPGETWRQVTRWHFSRD